LKQVASARSTALFVELAPVERVAAPGLSTIGSVQRVGVGAPTPDPALLRNATFSPQAHGCPEKMSRVNQSVAAHAPQNKGTR
jgi:hypothetical protein